MSNTITMVSESTRITNLSAMRMAAQSLNMSIREAIGNDLLAFRTHGSESGKVASMVLALPGNKNAYEIGLVWDEKEKAYFPRLDTWQRGQGLLDHVQYPSFKHCQNQGDVIDKLMAHYRLAEVVQSCEAAGLAYEIITLPSGEFDVLTQDQSQAYEEPVLAVQ